MDEIDEAMGCVYLWWSIDDEKDHIGSSGLDDDDSEVDELSGIEPFCRSPALRDSSMWDGVAIQSALLVPQYIYPGRDSTSTHYIQALER